MSFFILNQVKRDILILTRNPLLFLVPVLFFVLVCVLFPLSVSVDASHLQLMGAGVIWIGLLLAHLLSLSHLFQEDYEHVVGQGMLKKLERGNQDQLNPDFLEIKKNKYIEVKTATIYKGNKFIFEQIRLKDPRINYYVFLGITPEGRFYWVLDKKNIKPGKPIFGAKFSPQHSTTGSNATYQWHPGYEQMINSIVKPNNLASVIV